MSKIALECLGGRVPDRRCQVLPVSGLSQECVCVVARRSQTPQPGSTVRARARARVRFLTCDATVTYATMNATAKPTRLTIGASVAKNQVPPVSTTVTTAATRSHAVRTFRLATTWDISNELVAI